MIRSSKPISSVWTCHALTSTSANLLEDLFVESKCDDEDLIMSNILEVKTTSPDYIGCGTVDASACYIKQC